MIWFLLAAVGAEVFTHTLPKDGSVVTLTVQTPKLCDDVQQYSGYFQLGESNKRYFYWFFESRNDPASDPTLMWLTGGPGCSSQLALLSENGPCKVNSDGTGTTKNEESWNSRANAMWVDQPPGTGFSEGVYDHGEAGVGDDMYAFLQAFFTKYPKYNKNFYVTGESYAGHYVPAVTHRIFVGNKEQEGVHIDLKGFAIGNGLTDPEEQYKWYPKMAYNSTTAPAAVNKVVYNIMELAVLACIPQIKKCNELGGQACITAVSTCNLALVAPYQITGKNPYDMRKKCEHPPLCYDFSNVEKFLNRPDVQKQLGVNKQWTSCNKLVTMLFQVDWMHSFQQLLPPMIASGIRVLIFAGDQDYICNWLGNKAWTLKMDWPGRELFNFAKDIDWNLPSGHTAGKLRQTKDAPNFAFLQVYKAGHMVPMDQPEAAKYMIDSFLDGHLASSSDEIVVI